MGESKSSLSVGEVVRTILLNDKNVTSITNHIFPVVTQLKAELPYIVYRRLQLDARNVKEHRSSDEVEVEVMCCAEHYDESVRLAENVRLALDGTQAEYGELFMSKCVLKGASEYYESDAFVQYMVYNIKIQ